eukprot:TRINITY_DN59958_c0_g1_i1.p1 TRINITY_DN59958_c0_g1~~TRINITY_DN59958_c0_g1_i1.p1  ORF type:complete len:263 (+),score=25.62 TRINITY_DN59958_c0_g1_i1:31-789(+)
MNQLKGDIGSALKIVKGLNIASGTISGIQGVGNLGLLFAGGKGGSNVLSTTFELGRKLVTVAGVNIPDPGTLNKIGTGLNIAGSVFTATFSIISAITISYQQADLDEKKELFDQEMTEYMKLKQDMSQKQLFLFEVFMTTETKQKVCEELSTLIRMVNNAIREAKMITKTWTDIYQQIDSMRKTSQAGQTYSDEQDKEAAFNKVFDFLRGMNSDWTTIQTISLTISDTFNENEENDLEKDIAMNEILENSLE